ncbi:MAG TPA: F0F1 ATP synthase subunit epsilon [Actinophytocola sp.]|nr:F0F1 ATP synthase subunit epsilon [Actinophytocola sp.]
MADMRVELVAPDRLLWTGQATFVFARTTAGEIGILPRHIPLMAELVAGEMVRIDTVDDGEYHAAVHGGFLSVTEEGVTILAEEAEPAEEIDVEQAQREFQSDDEEVRQRARARLRAAGHSTT